ncbi:MAG: glycosyltransferase [Alphaproteobacteria bacterium]|nr:glycosyltransferase [Alphaproteobacteria bacterium]
MTTPRIAYVMKRYPRLTETFILNEIAAMEGLGAKLELFSLLQPEPPPHHPMVAEIRSPLCVLPPAYFSSLWRLAQAHGRCVSRAPSCYARALGRAAGLALTTGRLLGIWKQFLRAGFVADECVRRNVTLIHAHFANVPARVAWFASAMTGIPYSFTTHAKDLYLARAAALRLIVRDAAFVATCTQYNADYLRSILNEQDHSRIHVVYHGVEISRFIQRAATPRTDRLPPLILSVGRLVPKKGFRDLIAACRALYYNGIRFRCVIVGEGPLRGPLQAAIDRQGLSDLITLTGAMTHADLMALYGEADVFVLPSRVVANGDRDGIPNVIVEAMASNVPVVSTSVSGIPEVVQNGVTGLLVPPESPTQLAEALRRLLGERAYGARLARTARARVEHEFDCRETTKALRDLMHGCCCGDAHEEAQAAPVPARPALSTAEAAE